MKNNVIRYSRKLATIGTIALTVLLLSIFVGCAKKQANPTINAQPISTKKANPKANSETIPQAVKNALDSTVRLILKDAEGNSLKIGSGFFVRPGLIVTNLHVVKDAVKRGSYAQLVGKKVKYPIESIARNSKYSLAILKVNAPDVKPLSIGNSDSVQIGNAVYAVGNPPELRNRISSDSVQIGNAVYAVGNPPELRNRISKGKAKEPQKKLLDDIKLEIWEITAPISSGISGGPVLNNEGKVIGVSARQVLFYEPPVEIHSGDFSSSISIKVGSRKYYREGSNFAISSKTLKALLNELKIEIP